MPLHSTATLRWRGVREGVAGLGIIFNYGLLTCAKEKIPENYEPDFSE